MGTITIEGRPVTVSDDFFSLTPEQQNATVDEIHKSLPSVWGGRAKQAGVGLAKGVIGLGGMAGDAREAAGALAEKLGADRSAGENVVGNIPVLGVATRFAPSSRQIRETVEPYTGKFREPETTAEKYIDTAAQFVPSTIGPGGLVRGGVNALKYGVAPGVVSEFAGQQAAGTPYEPWVRGGAALATGAGVAGVTGLVTRPSAAARNIRGAIPDNIQPQALDAAERLFQEAQAAGQPITRAEAIQKVTQGGTSMGNLQRVVEGQGELRPMMSGRAAGNESAAREAFDTIAPPTNQPSMIGPNAGEAATKTIRDLEGARTRAVTPFYDAAAKEKVPTAEVRGLVKDIDAAIKSDKTGIVGEGLQEIRDLLIKQKPREGKPAEVVLHDAGVPEPFATANPVKEVIPAVKRKNQTVHTDIETLDRVRKYVRDKVGMPQIGADAITKEQGAAIISKVDDLKQRMLAASTNFKQGKELYEDITKKYIEPIMAGPLGRLAQKDITTQNGIKALFPAKELLPGSEHEVSTAVSALVKRNPEAAKRLVRAHAEMVFDQASKNLIKGANEFGGAKFAAGIRGNPQQAKNLEAAVRALPNGDQIYKGFDRFLEIVEAQGQRQAIGSQTAFNTELMADLKRGTPLQEAGNAALTGGLKLPARIKETFDQWRLGRGAKDIAHLLVDPASANRFRAIAQMPSGSSQARNVAFKLVLMSAQAQRSSRSE